MPAPDILDIVISAPPGGEIAVVVAEPDEAPVTVTLPAEAAVEVTVTHALPGAPGTSVTPVVLTLAAYLALTVPQQTDPTKFYVIPTTS